jgi:hypothetical protein
MPKKSRRFKMLQSKRKKIRQHSPDTFVQPPVVTQTDKPVASVPPVAKSIPKATSNIARYPYVIAELRRIGILAGIMLVILIVLALALS